MRLLIGLALLVSAALLFTDNPSLLVRVTDFVVVAFVAGAVIFVRDGRRPMTCGTCRNSMLSIAAGLECTNGVTPPFLDR